MSKLHRLCIAVGLAAVAVGAASAQTPPPPAAKAAAAARPRKISPKDLPPQYRKWLEEEVPYIITPVERDVFLQLTSDRERQIFIDAFWKQRDPNPSTGVNEFQVEHERRLAYANQWFGRDSPGEGWRTDQGRIYIILGEPKQIEKYENLPDLFPTVIWFYDGMVEYGLPNAFSVVFYKKNGLPPYELYSPVKDGPQALLIHYRGDMTDYESAYSQLMQIEPNVANVSISLIQGESMMSISPSISSEVLLGSKIPAAPRTKVKDEYARKLLRYKDVIDVDYTANYIDNESLLRVYQDPAGGPAFVHYLLEPKRLTFEEVPGKFIANLEVNGSVSDAAGKPVYQFERKAPIEMTRDQLDRVRNRLFSFQDLFPLLPGTWKVSILWKNSVSREFTSLETTVTVPEAAAFSMSAPVLGNRVDKNSPQRGRNKSFLFGGLQVVASPRNDFTKSDTMYVFTQLRNVPADVREGGSIAYTIFKGEVQSQVFETPLREVADLGAVLREIPLAGMEPNYYRIRVSILDAAKAERVGADAPFYITPLEGLPRPWVMSMPLPPSNDASIANALGRQYLAVGRTAQAQALLEGAWRAAPESMGFALDVVRLRLQAKDYAGALEAAKPFLSGDQRNEFLQPAGEAYQAQGDFAKAAELYREYLTRLGTNLVVLNALGECAFKMGDTAGALYAWEKSLELSPDQPEIRAKIKSVKGK